MRQKSPDNARSGNRVFDNKLNWRQDADRVTVVQKNTITVPKD